MIQLSKRPTFPKTKLTPLQRAGLTYERKVFRELCRLQKTDPSFPKGQLLHNQWFKITNGNDISFCCPDILLVTSKEVFIFECKLTQTDCSEQLTRYAKICEEFFSLPTIVITIFRNLLRKENLLSTLADAKNGQNWHLFL